MTAAHILVVDDEELVRDLIVEILARAGYDAVAAKTPEEAFELLAGVALVISDILMPGLSGFELLDRLRSRRPSVPVLLITGASTEAAHAEALARGAADLVAKPFSHAELRERVAAILERPSPD